MNDREMRKMQSDKLFDLGLLKRASAEKREKLIDNQILRAKASMTAEEVSHVLKLVEDADI